MNLTTSIKALNAELPALYGERMAIHLEGSPGQGKSEVILNSGEIICPAHGISPDDWAVLDFSMTSVDSLDIRGICVPTKTATGASAFFTRSPIYDAVLRTGCQHGILLLDELNAADGMVQKAVAPTLLSRQLGADTLPPGWMVVSASNRTKDRSGANAMLRHIINRVTVYQVSNDVESLLAWWDAKGLHPLGSAFIQTRPGTVFTEAVPVEPVPYCTPRSYAMLWRRIEARGIAQASKMMATMAGQIGEGAATELLAFLSVADLLPSLEDMRTNPSRCELPPRSRLDAQYALASTLVHYATVDDIEWTWTIAERMRPEFSTAIATRSIEKCGHQLMNSPKMATWISKNSDLIAAS